MGIYSVGKFFALRESYLASESGLREPLRFELDPKHRRHLGEIRDGLELPIQLASEEPIVAIPQDPELRCGNFQ
jgi:hypothetical protein